MSTSVDERIVSMKIDNAQLLSGVKSTQTALQGLNKVVNSSGSATGMSKLGTAVEAVKVKFSSLNVVAATVVGTITNKLVNAGLNFAKSMVISPIEEGFKNYEQQINAAKIVLANTKQSGVTLADINKQFAILQGYAQKTVYNFGQMTEAVSQFTASGVGLKASTEAVQGIGNLAAMSGASADHVHQAYTQMGQAIQSGFVKLQDWRSFVNEGLASPSFQRALAYSAQAMGDLGHNAVQLQGPMKNVKIAGEAFQSSLQSKKGMTWLTSKAFSTTLDIMSGKLTAGDLKAKGYTATQIKYLEALAKTAEQSATQVKTFSQLMSALREEVAASYGMLFKTVLGSLPQATKMFSAIHNSLDNMQLAFFTAINNVLKKWAEFGGRKALIQSVANVWNALAAVFHAVSKAWDEAFPGSGSKIARTLANMNKWFRDFTASLIPSKSALKDITDIFKAVFQVLGVGVAVVSNVFRYFFSLFGLFINSGASGGAAQGVLAIVAAIARMVTGFLQVVDLKGKLDGFFNAVIAARKAALEPILKTLGDVFHALDPLLHGDFSGFVDGLKKALGNLGGLGNYVAGIGNNIQKLAEKLAGKSGFLGFLGRALQAVSNWLKDAGKNVQDFFKKVSSGTVTAGAGFWGNLLNILQAIGGYLKTLWGDFNSLFDGIGHGSATAAVATISGLKDGAKGAAKAGSVLSVAWHGFVSALQWIGKQIGPIASAIGGGVGKVKSYLEGLFGSMDKMSLVQTVQLIFSAAVFVYIKRFMDTFKGAFAGFKEIIEKSGNTMDQLTSNLKTMQTSVRVKMILEIAIAIGILAASLWVLSKIPAKSLGVSLGAITIMLTELIGAMALLQKVMSPKAAAETEEGGKKVGKFGKLFGGFSETLQAAKLPILAASLILMAGALIVMGGAVAIFGQMDWKTLGKGFAGITASLALLVGASVLMSKFAPTAIVAAGAILILSVALGIMAGTLLLFSKIKWSTLLSGMAKIAVTLTILGVAMSALTELDVSILAGAAAIGLLALSLDLMAGTLNTFSKISMSTIIKSMIKIAVVIGILAAVASVASAPLAAFGAALALIGLGVLAIGAGMALFGAGLAVLAATGTAAFAVLVAGMNAFLAVLPLMGIQFVAAITTILQALAKESPKIVDSLVTIGNNLLRGFVELLPAIGNAVEKLIELLIKVIVDEEPKIYAGGIQLLTGLIKALGDNAPKLMDQMGQTVLQLLTGLDNAIKKYEPQIIHEGLQIGKDLISGLVKGLVPAPILHAFSSMVKHVLNFFKGLLGIHSPSTVFAGFGRNIVQGLVNGLSGLASSLGHAFSNAWNFAKGVVTGGINSIISLIRGIPGKISSFASTIGDAAKAIGTAIWHGITGGLGKAGDFFSSIASSLKSGLNSILGLPKTFGFSALGHHIGFTIPGFARGTDRFGGGLAMVGEAGAELVSMPGGSSVITNKNLIGFMKAINALAETLGKNKASKTVNHEGSIVYKVGAHFEGDPKKNGLAFAGNLLAGLKNGLASGQNGVNSATTETAKGLTKSFAKELGIHSPSKVFEDMGFNVTKGFVNGILKSMKNVMAAGALLAKNTVDAASKTATLAQQKADALQAKADALRAAKNDKKYFSSLSKAQKTALNQQIQKAQKAADVAQGGINSANAAATEKKRKANASDAENASVFGSRANAQAKAAEKDRQNALKLSKEADLIRSKDAKKAAQLDKQATAALTAAQKAATTAKSLATTAQGYAISAAIKSQKDTQQQLTDSLLLAKGTDAAKLSYYQDLQKRQQGISDAAYAQAQKLLDKAKAEEATNAAQAKKDTALAAAQIAKAEDAATQASDAASQASQFADQASTDSTATQAAVQQLTMPDINIASNAVFGAQNMFDAYSKALTATVAAAADAGPTIQLTQNNTSPKALSASEIYRNTQNLLSNTERKLTGTRS